MPNATLFFVRLTMCVVQVPERGIGSTLRFGSALHFNITGALLRVANDTLRMIQSASVIHNVSVRVLST